jgi:hypothetical protein
MLRTIIVTAVLLVAGSPVLASSPQAWAQMDRRVNRACIAMSGLARPQVLGTKISFSDVIGVEARMIRGVDNRGRMKRLLCAYNRRTGRTEVQEASSWLAPSVRP